MDTIAAYSFGNLAWLGIQGLPLVVWPKFISSLLRPEYQEPSSLETYFARSLGFSLISLGLLAVLLTGAVPLVSLADAPSDAVSPYANAVLVISALHHASAAFYCYGRFQWTGQTAYLLGCIGSAIFSTFGVFCLMFAGDKSRLSKHLKLDKDTSGFPFKNAGSYKAKKKGM